MADYDCDYCGHGEYCEFIGESTNCYVETIKDAKKLVDADFKAFYEKLLEKEGVVYHPNLDLLIGTMKWIIRDSEEELPEWYKEVDT